MSWLDLLLDRGNEARRAEPGRAMPLPERMRPATRSTVKQSAAVSEKPAAARIPKADLKTVWVTTRSPVDDEDPGACEMGHYAVVDGVLILCDKHGRPGKSYPLGPEDDAHKVAGRLTREAWLRRTDDFHRPLDYQPLGIV